MFAAADAGLVWGRSIRLCIRRPTVSRRIPASSPRPRMVGWSHRGLCSESARELVDSVIESKVNRLIEVLDRIWSGLLLAAGKAPDLVPP